MISDDVRAFGWVWFKGVRMSSLELDEMIGTVNMKLEPAAKKLSLA